MKIYRSKVDWWLVLLFISIFGFPIIERILTNDYLKVFIFSTIIIILYFLSKTIKYTIKEEILIIWQTKIDIKTIKKIYKTNNPLSSPALSLNRIAVVYNKYDEILISPKERQSFIDELLKINPNFELVI